jgi:hypothetical protein
VEEILNEAESLEKGYEWLGAAESYEKALKLLPENDFLRMGQIYECLGYAFYRAAMQAESQEKFKERMQRAIEVYEKAHGSYEELVKEPKVSMMFRCKAMMKYLGYWLASVPSEKRKLLDECLDLEGKAMEAFLESGNMLEYGKTYNELSLVFLNRFYLEWNGQTAESIVKTGVEWGEKAILALLKLDNPYEIARAHLTLATCLDLFSGRFIAEPEEREKNRLRVVKYLSETAELSEKLGDSYLFGLSHLWWGNNTGGGEAVKHFEKTFECGKLARDNFLIACGSDLLAYMTWWKTVAIEDPEKTREMAEKTMRFYDEAQRHYSIMSYASPRAGAMAQPAGYAEYYFYSATWETDPNKKLQFLEKSEKAGIQALKEAEASDMPEPIRTVFHELSRTLEVRANMEQGLAEKRSCLERALKYREKEAEILDQVAPFHYWDQGVSQDRKSGIKALLADVERNPDNKRRLLEDAVLSKEKCMELWNKMMPYYELKGDISRFAMLHLCQDAYAKMLTWLYNLTDNPEHLRKAIEALQKAIESASKLGMISRVAESYWKMAHAQDILGEYLRAAESFKHASENYVKAAEKLPQLNDFYQDYAGYMHSWNEIEEAKHHHVEKQYGLAREHYEKAADMHNATQRWKCLSPNYLAWAKLEEAEDLSRKEQAEEAKGLFKQAADLFAEAKKSIQSRLEKIENKDEKEMSISLAKASDVRHEYCLGRIALEEAKILDRQGDHDGSSSKYGSASGNFQRAMDAMERETDRKELKPIVFLCRAWQVMTRAEAEASPEMYEQASRLFEEAKGYSLDEKEKMLALGHSRFCKALEAGTRFEDSRDASLHTLATQHLESAAGYYLKAGFQGASEYARATRLLFDAYVYMDNAMMEKDPEKKAKFYTIAEKVLQTSAGYYKKAEHPEKTEQVTRLLDNVRDEKELAVSLIEVMHAPSVVSATMSFAAPTPTSEEAVGSERFEHADIQANLIIRRKELRIGDNLGIELELFNAGKRSALLTKVMEMVPKGFELAEKSENCRVEDSYINLKGKRLDPLKTEEVRLVLKPTIQGTFSLKPTVLYLDENGKYKSHEPEPATIVVKELGIKGWLKGER